MNKKIIFLKFVLISAVVCGVVFVSDAQKKKTTKTKPKTVKVDPFGNPITDQTDNKATNKTNTNNNSNTSVDPFGATTNNNATTTTNKVQQPQKLDTVIVKSNGSNPLTDIESPSLRNDFAVQQVAPVREQIPLVYDPIREDDAVYTQRLWSVIDTREKMNLIFRNPRDEDNGSQLFFVILYKAVSEGGVTAFEDEKFKKPISKERFLKDYAGGYDTIQVHGNLDEPDKVTKIEIRPKEFPVDSVYKFMVKEDVIFDKESSKLVRRIIAIAPMMPPFVNGKLVEGISTEATPKFWLYYNDLRPILAKYRVFNAKNYGANMSWDDLFQARMYSSYIVKTTLDNQRDLALKDYISDPLFRLLEGEKIKEKIFNYEQNLWQY